MAPCGAGDPFDCGRRARKSRWKSRAGAESTRLVVLVPQITVLQAWDTLRDCSLAAASIACSTLALANAALAKPTGTVALANPAIVIAATVISQSAAAVALAATAVALSPPPGHHHRHRHRPRRHGLRHPLPGRRRRRLRLRLRLCRRCPARLVRLRRPRLPRHCRGTRRLSHSIAPHRDGVRSVCGTSWFSLRFCLKAPHKRQIFSRGCRPAPRGGPRSAFFTIPAVSGAHFGSTTVLFTVGG